MLGYLVRRIALTAATLLMVTLITFSLAFVIPGDPARLIAGDMAPKAQVERVRQDLRLSDPIPVQYVRYLGRLLRGDMGVSIHTRRPVARDIAEFLAATLELTTFAIVLAVGIGIAAGVFSAAKRGSPVDHVTRVVSLAGVSMPVFWLGLILQLFFSMKLNWLPLGGRLGLAVIRAEGFQRVTGFVTVDALLQGSPAILVNALQHLVLPALCLAYPAVAVVARMSRTNMLEVLGEDYIRTARAYGFSERVVVYKYGLRNALVPTVTVVALVYAFMLGGSFLVESVFSWPGLGRYAVFSIVNSDYPAIMGTTLVVALIYIVTNLVVDICYSLIDPRIQYGH